MDLNYKKDIEIDPNNLLDEVLTHASKYLKYSEAYTEAVYLKDLQKAKLEITIAEVDSEVRRKYKKFGFSTKPAESAIKQTVSGDKRVIKANKKLIVLQKQVNLYAGIKSAFDHRKRRIEDAVFLTTSGLYSTPKTSKTKYEKAKEKADRIAKEGIQQELTEKKKKKNRKAKKKD